MERLALGIHPNGKFRYTDHFDTEEGFSEKLLAGRVMPDRIVGAYREFERTVSDACGTGTRKHPKIRFVARRGAG